MTRLSSNDQEPAVPNAPGCSDLPRRRKPSGSIFRRLRRDEKGVTALEFAMVAGPFFAFMFAIMEVAFWFIGTQALDNAVMQVGRKARTGEALNMTQADIVNEICQLTQPLFPNCSNQIIVNVKPYSTFSSAGFTNNGDANGNLNPNASSSVTPCPPNSVCVVEAEIEWDLLLNIPSKFATIMGMKDGMDLSSGGSNGKTRIKSTVVFRSEPYL